MYFPIKNRENQDLHAIKLINKREMCGKRELHIMNLGMIKRIFK